MPVLGTDVILFFLKDDIYQPFLCATECSISIEIETKQVRTINQGKWKKKRGQSLDYKVSLSGLIQIISGSPRTFWLVENAIQMLLLNWRMVFTEAETGLIKIASGNAIINVAELVSSSSSFATSSFDFEGDGELVLADSATTCNATIGSIEIGPGNIDIGAIASVAYSGVVNAARLEYSVDGGGREAIFDPGSTGIFYLFGLGEGSHTLEVWTVCFSGVDGEYNELIFNIEGEGPVGCAVPGDPSVTDLTATTARIEWPAASPAPGDGYGWRYGSLSGIIESGTTTDLFKDLTGLDTGALHYFDVWSICEAGVSESGFKEVQFVPAGETCVRPGALTITYNTGGEVTVTFPASPSTLSDGYYSELVDSLGNVTPLGYSMDLQTGAEGLTDGETYIINVYAVCSPTDMSSASSISFVSGGVAVCNVPGTPVMSLITETSATATWTAPSPAPGSGYSWQLLNGVTAIDSGTTGSLSVNLTGMPSGTSLTFQVKAICGVGSESGYNSIGFTTDTVANNIDWGWTEDEGNGTLVIRVNGVDVVNETTAGTGNFTCDAGDSIQVFLTASTGTITVDDLTASTQIVNESDSGITIGVFTTVSGHNYSITAEVTS